MPLFSVHSHTAPSGPGTAKRQHAAPARDDTVSHAVLDGGQPRAVPSHKARITHPVTSNFIGTLSHQPCIDNGAEDAGFREMARRSRLNGHL